MRSDTNKRKDEGDQTKMVTRRSVDAPMRRCETNTCPQGRRGRGRAKKS